MSYIKLVETGTARGSIKQIYDAAIKRAGAVANIVRLMSLDGSICNASLGLYIATMKSDNVLDKSTRELLAAVVSNVNDCFY